ncbi:MAG: MFS transporter [Actinomycetota bacterium]
MHVPYRLQRAFRVQTEPGIVLAMAVATATFVATPLLLSPLADEFGVGTGTVALFSAAQLACFVLGSSVTGRITTPSRRVFVGSLAVLVVANLASAVSPNLATLVGLRAVVGLALGTLTWLAYSQVFGDAGRTGDLTVVGPIAAVVASPVHGVVIDSLGPRAVFLVLAMLSLVPLTRLPAVHVPPVTERSSRNRAVKAALVVIGALTFATLGGSAVFVFIGAIGQEQYGLSAFTMSLVFSANAAASIPSARYRGRRPFAGAFYVITAACALAVGFLDDPVAIWVIMIVWGAAFWAATPGAYTILAERSRFPTERAGDAQAAMAAGRAIGPLLGGALVSAGSFEALSVVGASLVLVAAVTIVAVELLIPPVVEPPP